VVAGSIGSVRRLEFTLIGVPVNNSAYLSKVRPPAVLMSEATAHALKGRAPVQAREPMTLKGAEKAQPVYAFEVS
jgi:class 3 adenylate cyclase